MQDRKYITNIYIALSRCFLSLLQDSEVWEQIDRDVKRTHPDMHFFCGDSTSSLENQVSCNEHWLNFILLHMCVLNIILVNYHHSSYVHF